MSINHSHPLAHLLDEYRLVLGSKSPRRVQLLRELGVEFEVRPSDADEHQWEGQMEIPPYELPCFLAKFKADALLDTLTPNELLITADTIVFHKGRVLGKPSSIEEAKAYLRLLSDDWHSVITGYTLTTLKQQFTEGVKSEIRFVQLTEEEINYYVSRDEVLDKAGAYGVQDWIGLIGVAEIRGSYHNVMGLPTSSIYHKLKMFLEV